MSVPYRFLTGLLFLAVPLAAPMQAQNWKDMLENALKEAYKPTRTTSDGIRITEYGAALVVQKEGIVAKPSRSMTLFVTHVLADGQIQQAKGFAAAMVGNKTAREFHVSDKVYLKTLDVKDAEIELRLLSAEITPVVVKGSTEQVRYLAVVRFDFPKDFLQTASVDSVRAALAGVVSVESQTPSGPKTLAIGQTPEQVESILGKPDTILDLGAKKIWVYKTLKVTFVDGKVSDIQ